MSGSNALLHSIANPEGLSPNLLSSYGQGQDIAAKQWQNREAMARQLAGQAQQGAIDPATGQYSPDKFRQNLAGAGPGAALAAREGLASNQQLSSDQFNQAREKTAWINNAAGAALKAGDFSDAGMLKIMHDGLAGGILTLPEIQQQLTTMPADPAGRKLWLEQHQGRAMSTQQQLEQQYGTRPAVNAGDRVVFPVVPPASSPSPGPVVPLRTSPETKAGMVETYEPDPQRPGSYLKVMKPRMDLPGASGVPGDAAAPSPTNQPRLPTAAKPAPGTPGGPVLAQPPAGTTESNQADTTTYKRDQAAVPAHTNNINNLTNAYKALQLTNAGRSTEATHALYSFMQAQGLLIGPLAGLSDDVKNYDIFRKSTERYAMDQGTAAGTDAGRAMSAASNAGTAISTPANLDVMRFDIGRERMAIAQVQAHKDQTGIGYGAHASTFASSMDPHGFAADMYTPAELKAYEATLKGPAKTRFFASLAMAQRMKLLNLPAAAP